MVQEKVQIDYDHNITYNNTALNAVGATDSLTLRTLPDPAYSDADTKHVRKFGAELLMTYAADAIQIDDPDWGVGDNGLRYKLYTADDNTLLYEVDYNGGSVSVSSITNEEVYITVLNFSGAPVTMSPSVTMTYNGTPLTVFFPEQPLAASETSGAHYVSASGSTYYDTTLQHGGARHTPDGTAALPYFTFTTAEAALGGAFDNVVGLDSEWYDEEINFDAANSKIFAALGQTPRICRPIGASIYRDVSAQWNNVTAVYFNENGSDANPGTWQLPFLTIAAAIAGRGAKSVIYGGTGATVSGGIFDVNVAIAAAYTFEADYGYTPKIKKSSYTGNSGITVSHTSANIYGFTIDSTNEIGGIYISGAWSGTISGNTISRAQSFGFGTNHNITGTITRNDVNNCPAYGISNMPNTSSTATISKNIFNTCGVYAIQLFVNAGLTQSCTITNNVIFSGTTGIYLAEVGDGTFSPTIENNTIYGNTSYGIWAAIDTAFTGTIRDNVVWGNGTYDMFKSGAAAAPSFTESNYEINSGWTVGAGNITTDPKFSSEIAPYKLGISPDSGAYMTDTSTTDMGAQLFNVLLGANGIVINGIIFDGLNQYHSAIKQNANYTGHTVQWCDIENYQGIGADFYNTATSTIIFENNWVVNNGNGLNNVFGSNEAEYCVIANNSRYGAYQNSGAHKVNHCVIYGNQYGWWFATLTTGVAFTNSIITGNLTYGVYSVTCPMALTDCDITDAVNANVDTSDASNLLANPLLVNPPTDFNIKVIENGYSYNSVCREAASDGYDIGAYLMSRSVAADSWKIHVLTYNPLNLPEDYVGKGATTFENAFGGTRRYGKGFRRLFNFQYSGVQFANETDRKKYFHFLGRTQTRENGYTDEQVRFRLHFLPNQKEEVITTAVMVATAKTITKAAAGWVEDEHKGFYISPYFASGANGMQSVATSHKGVVAAAGWVNDAYIGYYLNVFLGSRNLYLRITDNTATKVVVSDPHGYLTASTNLPWKIVKNFRISKNLETTIYVDDDNAELVSGTRTAHIDMIPCRVAADRIGYNQARFYRQQESWKTGVNLPFEEE